MSGGRLGYFYSDLESHVGDFEDKELDDLVMDLSNLFHAKEWYLSGDTCEGAWNEARDAFKKKWFTTDGRKERIEKYLEEFKIDMLKTLGLFDDYCMNCESWTHEKDGEYGSCIHNKHCLMYKCETCDKFTRRTN